MKEKRNQIIKACVIILIIYALSVGILAAISDLKQIDVGTPDAAAADWMSTLPDDKSIAVLSIPGTHDSATKYSPFNYSFQCQTTSVTEQLMMGYRFMDIRIKLKETKDGTVNMYLMHGIGHCKNSDGSYMTFEDFEKECLDFLTEHPGETIIVLVDAATSRNKNASSVSDTLQNYLSTHSDRWYQKNEIPTLGETRGKLILATRYGDVNDIGSDLCGWDLEWISQSSRTMPRETVIKYSLNGNLDAFCVQNWFKISVKNKEKAVHDALDGEFTSTDTLLINYLSISTEILFLPCPKLRAIKINEDFMNYEFTKGKSYGIVLVDFGTAEMAKKVYETN